MASYFSGNSFAQGQSQDQYSLQLQGFVWNRSPLNALVVTADNESWWNPNYLNITLRAIGQWNDALDAFASNYSDFTYLSTLRIKATVSNEPRSGFDIYVYWKETPLSNTTDQIGLSQFSASYAGTIVNCTVILATHDQHGDSLSEGDLQSVALHEFGHSLGLGHSDYSDDLMYAYYTRGSSADAVSTLDAYGVATLFAWEAKTNSFYPISGWLNKSKVILPSDIPYQKLPVSPQNALPQTLANSPVVQFLVLMFEILIHPEIFSIVLVFIVVFVVIALIPKRKNKEKAV